MALFHEPFHDVNAPVEDDPPAPKLGTNHPPAPKPKRKIGYNLQCALCEVIERKKVTDRPGYGPIARRHCVDEQNLRRVYMWWLRDEIELGPIQSMEDQRIDVREQLEKTIMLARRQKALLLVAWEKQLVRSEDAMTHGHALKWKTYETPLIIAQISAVDRLILDNAKGYSTLIDEENARRNQPKQIGDTPQPKPQLAEGLHSANEEELAMRALSPPADGT